MRYFWRFTLGFALAFAASQLIEYISTLVAHFS